MVRLKNTTGFRNVDDMISPENNAGRYIGMQNNRPLAISDIRKTFNILYTMDNCLNQCQRNFIETAGFVAGGKTFTVEPNTYDEITLTEPIVKTIDGLFERGNNNGCKDNSYATWNQPVLSDVETDLGKCSQTLGTNVQPAYWAMNGIFNDADDGWKSSTEISQWTFEAKIPFIVGSIVFTNTTDAYKTRLLTVTTSNKVLYREYYVNVDNVGKSYITIDSKLRDESNILNIKTLKSFYNQGVGFNEIVINGFTRYIQQNDTYNVFVIEDEEGNVDVLVSSYDEPELPEGFIKYAFVKKIRTEYDKIELSPVYGDRINFHTEEYPIVITKNGNVEYITEIDQLVVDWYDNEPTIYYVSVDSNGHTEASTTKPSDIILAEITCYKGNIVSVNQYACNDNGLFRYNERTLRTISEKPISNYHYDIETDLTGIVSVECVLKCLKINNGYAVGDVIPTSLTPTLNNNHIILNTQDIYIQSKFFVPNPNYSHIIFQTSDDNLIWNGTPKQEDGNIPQDDDGSSLINSNEWELIFRLKR